MAIPIENIYYLLCYAWDTLEEKDRVKVAVDDSNGLLDLFAKVLLSGTRILLKRGLERNYITETVELAGVKGKLEMSPTLKSGIYFKQRTICTIDEFSANILSNRILVSTIYRLIQTKELDIGLKKQLKPLVWMFSGIEPIELSSRVFSQVRLHRNNHFYAFLLKICRIIYENTLPTEKPGEWHFIDFTRDRHKMNQLFEAFVRNFYRREFPHWKVWSEQLKWQFEVSDETHRAYIPVMKTDISIQNEHGKTIIDAKYYQETLTSRFEQEKLQSHNLYQLFSYLMNQQSNDPASKLTRGMLLYPETGRELDLDYWYNDHLIQIKTVNLNEHWGLIEKRLKTMLH
jgi:5-methylcytosine-specific restriction enzyme subunit McrC